MRLFVLGIFLMLVGNTAAAAEPISHHLEGTADGTKPWSPRLLLREQLPANGDRSRPVLYVHGATFPSALSMMFKFGGVSWADNLNSAGFDVFALDFAGYGGSERYTGMSDVTPSGKPLGRASEAAIQIERAVRYIIRSTGARSVDIIAHSWGTIPAGLFAGKHPGLVRRLVLFGPIGARSGSSAETAPAWELVTVAQQHARFVRAVPPGEPGVLLEEYFPAWAEAYLASDPESRARAPYAVKVPGGPSADIEAAWGGRLPYSPGNIRAPTLIIRGEWDTTSPDADMNWLRDQLTNAKRVEMVKISRATHLMHLERGRGELYRATQRFLDAPERDDDALPDSLFAVVFEAQPNKAYRADYLRLAGEMKPLVQNVPGFLMNERFRSRTEPDRLLSISFWTSEKSLADWRKAEQHRRGQKAGRDYVLSDYRLRVGEVTRIVGNDVKRATRTVNGERAAASESRTLLLLVSASRLIPELFPSCHLFDHLTEPGRMAAICECAGTEVARRQLAAIRPHVGPQTSAYVIDVVRAYGMHDRREAPAS